MNAPHWHLLLNHIPIVGTIFGLGLLAYALWRKSAELRQAAFGVFVLTGLLALPAYFTGEPSEDAIASFPGVSKALIEQHEEVANFAFAGVLGLGAAALVGLIGFRKRKAVPGWFASLLLAASLIVSGLMAWTANLGGQVRHPEIRSGTSASVSNRE